MGDGVGRFRLGDWSQKTSQNPHPVGCRLSGDEKTILWFLIYKETTFPSSVAKG